MNVKEYKSIVGANFTPKKRIKHEEDNLQAKVCSYLSKFENVVYWSTPNGIYIKNNNKQFVNIFLKNLILSKTKIQIKPYVYYIYSYFLRKIKNLK